MTLKKELPLRIAVTGANGFVGQSLIKDLLARGHQVRALVRFPDAALANLPLETIATGPIEAIGDWRPYLTGIDAVVHLAARAHLNDRAMLDAQSIRAVNTTATLALAKSAAKRKIGHFVYLSSIGVHGEATPEGKAFRSDSPFSPQTNYTRSKVEAEEGLRALQSGSAMGITVLRPPLIYGPGTRGNFRALCRLVAQAPVLPLGSICNRRSLIAVENLTSAIGAILDMNNAAFQSYVISDGLDFSLPELVRLAAEGLQKNCLLLPVPRWLLLSGATLAGKKRQMQKLTQSLQIDMSEFRDDFGWQPVVKPKEALKKAARACGRPS